MALATVMIVLVAGAATAQVGPADIDGFVEYQYRLTKGKGQDSFGTHFGTVFTQLSSYVWQPWIMQVNASLGLTKTRAETPNSGVSASQKRRESFVTGRLNVDILRQSRFPFLAYAETLDSRVDSDVQGLEGVQSTLGFMQRFMPRSGGQFLFEYRRNMTERFSDDLSQAASASPLEHSTDRWQARMDKGFGRHRVNYNAVVTDFARSDTLESKNDNRHTLRHRYLRNSSFSLENTFFVSDESIERQSSNVLRVFRQFNSILSWRPEVERPLVITGRALLHDIESGQTGSSQNTQNIWVSGSLTYQPTDHVTLGAAVGSSSQKYDPADWQTRTFSQLSAQVRSKEYSVLTGRYRSSGAIFLLHEKGSLDPDGAAETDELAQDELAQDLSVNLNHTLSKQFQLASGYQLDLNVSQDWTGQENREGERGRILGHRIFGTLSRQRGNSNSYLRVSATDRRQRGLVERNIQLVNLQLSRTTRFDRRRSLGGSLTYQYSNNQLDDINVGSSGSHSTNYSANINYRHADIVNVRDLDFFSELRAQSSEFVSDDPFDEISNNIDETRSDVDWRNRLIFNVGKLRLRLDANFRQVGDRWSKSIYFRVRRYYDIR